MQISNAFTASTFALMFTSHPLNLWSHTCHILYQLSHVLSQSTIYILISVPLQSSSNYKHLGERPNMCIFVLPKVNNMLDSESTILQQATAPLVILQYEALALL